MKSVLLTKSNSTLKDFWLLPLAKSKRFCNPPRLMTMSTSPKLADGFMMLAALIIGSNGITGFL